MGWTKQKPTKPGWYWVYASIFFGPVHVNYTWPVDEPEKKQLEIIWPQEVELGPSLDCIDWWWPVPLIEPKPEPPKG